MGDAGSLLFLIVSVFYRGLNVTKKVNYFLSGLWCKTILNCYLIATSWCLFVSRASPHLPTLVQRSESVINTVPMTLGYCCADLVVENENVIIKH